MPISLNRNTQAPWPAGTLPDGSGGGTARKTYQNGWRWKAPESRTQILPYVTERWQGSVLTYGNPHPIYRAWVPPVLSSSTPWFGASDWGSGYADPLRNRCYAKFKEKALGDTASIGTFIAEGREAYGMIANRAMGLYKAFKALKRGRFKQFLQELRVKPLRKHRNKLRSAAHEASGLWLEYWFGWSPSIQDMYTAVDLLNRNLKQERVKGGAGAPFPEVSRDFKVSSGYGRWSLKTTEAKVIWSTGATLQITNPNLLLASQMGLINPLSIALELVPFSFVVNWFTSFQNVVNAMTDFLGLALHDAYNTVFGKFRVSYRTWDARAPGNSGEWKYWAVRMQRSKGLIQPVTLYPKLCNFGTSKTRAATAVSLLTALFIKP